MKLAYNHIILPDGTCHSQVVVDFDAAGNPLSWHLFTAEEPFTQWRGGTYHWKSPSLTVNR